MIEYMIPIIVAVSVAALVIWLAIRDNKSYKGW